jgi:hypothetical protein
MRGGAPCTNTPNHVPAISSIGHRMSHLPLITTSSSVTWTVGRLSVALPMLLAITLSSASPVRAQWVARSEGEESTTPARPGWSPNRPSPTDEARSIAPPGQDHAVRDSHTSPRSRPLARVAQASGVAKDPVSAKFNANAEEIPAPVPMRSGPLRTDDRQFENREPFVDDGLPAPCDDDYRCNPCAGCPDFDNGRLFGGRLWGRGEYLLWWTRGSNLPALVTTSPAGTSPQDSGILGQPGTSVLFGDREVMTDARSGGRFTLGYLLLPCADLGVEANYLFLGPAASHYRADNTTIPILARPYHDLGTNAESALLVAHPDFLNGSVLVNATTDFQGGEVLLRKTAWQGYCERFDFLLGYRFAKLNDGLRISQTSQWTQPQGIIPPGTTKDLFDSFDTQNEFNGGELGLAYRQRLEQWSLELLGKVALGNTSSQVRVDGATATTLPDGRSATFAGGLLAQETNIGSFSRDQFCVVPEFGVTIGYNLTRQLRATFGYTFIYWNNVLRSGDQIDTAVSQLPPEPPTGDRRPMVPLKSTDFWAQGMNFGLDYCF